METLDHPTITSISSLITTSKYVDCVFFSYEVLSFLEKVYCLSFDFPEKSSLMITIIVDLRFKLACFFFHFDNELVN